MYAFLQEISLLKAISYDRNLVQFYGAVLNVEQPMLVSSCTSMRKTSGTQSHSAASACCCPAWRKPGRYDATVIKSGRPPLPSSNKFVCRTCCVVTGIGLSADRSSSRQIFVVLSHG